MAIGGSSKYVEDTEIAGCSTVGTVLTPADYLGRLVLTSNGQAPVVSATNSLAKLVHQYSNPDAKFIAGCYGRGSQSIAQLMSPARQAQIKAERGFDYDIVSAGCWQFFTDAVDYAAQIAEDSGQKISAPCIVFLQGEADYHADAGSSRKSYGCGGDKNLYKVYMERLKNDMQNYIMGKYHQTKAPLFYIYQCSGVFTANQKMTINMAQLEFAQEHDDVVLLPCPYFTPDYSDGHLSTNGYRWFGEFIAEAIFKTQVLHSEFKSMIVADVSYDAHHVYIDVANASLPMVFDTKIVEETRDYGFMIYGNDSPLTLTSVKIYGNQIVLTTAADLTSYTTLGVSYAGVNLTPTRGTGNVRDSDPYQGQYTYWDDSNDKGFNGKLTINYRPVDKDGNVIIGQKYPMYKWLSSFYYDVTKIIEN